MPDTRVWMNNRFRILKGFKSIAVGELCAAHGSIGEKITDPERVKPSPESIRERRATLAHGY